MKCDRPPPVYADPLDPTRAPKKYAPIDLQPGTLVFYRGDRYWVHRAPATWEETHTVRIGSTHKETDTMTAFCVHADLLDLAPQPKHPHGRLPTKSSVERKERAAKGQRDVGDEVAQMLRKAKTIEDVFKIGAKYLGEKAADLEAKYAHLDNGRKRMTIGNRMRAKWRKENA